MGDEIIAQLLSYSILCYTLYYVIWYNSSTFLTQKNWKDEDTLQLRLRSVFVTLIICFSAALPKGRNVPVFHIHCCNCVSVGSRRYWKAFTSIFPCLLLLLYILFESTKKKPTSRKEIVVYLITQLPSCYFLSDSCLSIFNRFINFSNRILYLYFQWNSRKLPKYCYERLKEYTEYLLVFTNCKSLRILYQVSFDQQQTKLFRRKKLIMSLNLSY